MRLTVSWIGNRVQRHGDFMLKSDFLPTGVCRGDGVLAMASSAYFVEAQKPVIVPPSRPKVALVFEGGGALGFAHIGVIEWMEAHHIPVDYVAGTSMGGLVGGLYASGNSPQEISTFMEGINWPAVLSGQVTVSGAELSAQGGQAGVSEPAGVWIEAWD